MVDILRSLVASRIHYIIACREDRQPADVCLQVVSVCWVLLPPASQEGDQHGPSRLAQRGSAQGNRVMGRTTREAFRTDPSVVEDWKLTTRLSPALKAVATPHSPSRRHAAKTTVEAAEARGAGARLATAMVQRVCACAGSYQLRGAQNATTGLALIICHPPASPSQMLEQTRERQLPS